MQMSSAQKLGARQGKHCCNMLDSGWSFEILTSHAAVQMSRALLAHCARLWQKDLRLTRRCNVRACFKWNNFGLCELWMEFAYTRII